MKPISPRAIRMRRSQCRLAAIALALTIVPTAGMAGCKVGGDLASVHIEAQNCSIQEILKSLADKFNIRYRLTANLSVRITGIYQGSLLDILPRLLTNYSYFIKLESGRLDLTVLGTGQSQSNMKPDATGDHDNHLDNAAEPAFGG